MREVSECAELKHFVDRRLVKALGHPVREHILAVLNERVASAREIGEELGADVSSFYHHVEELERLGCIERVESRRRRGVNEHFFRAKRTLFFDDAAWEKLPDSLKADTLTNAVQWVLDDVVAAMEAETFLAREETHVSWTPGSFDAQGWGEATDVVRQALERVNRIQRASAERLAKGAGSGMTATVAMLAFETPGSGGGSPASR